MDTLGHLLALYVTPANEQDRAQVEELACQVQAVTDQSVEVAFVDQGYTGDEPAEAAQAEGMRLEVIKLPEAKKGSCCSPDAGWWSVVSPGRLAFDAWLAITNACQRPWLASPIWPSRS